MEQASISFFSRMVLQAAFKIGPMASLFYIVYFRAIDIYLDAPYRIGVAVLASMLVVLLGLAIVSVIHHYRELKKAYVDSAQDAERKDKLLRWACLLTLVVVYAAALLAATKDLSSSIEQQSISESTQSAGQIHAKSLSTIMKQQADTQDMLLEIQDRLGMFE